MLVTIWLQAINPSLPALIKQRFATQLRSNTVYSLREEISDSIPVILSELDERECSINRAGAYQKKQSRGGYQRNYQSKGQGSYQYKGQLGYQSSKRKCSLCITSGKSSTDHFLSACPFLSLDDRKYISKTREITSQVEEEASDEGEYDYDDNDPSIKSLNVDLQQIQIGQGGGDKESKHMFSKHKFNKQPKVVNIRKVDVFASPILDTVVNEKKSTWTLDSGAEANCIEEEECLRLGLEIHPTNQSATQGDGRTPLPTAL